MCNVVNFRSPNPGKFHDTAKSVGGSASYPIVIGNYERVASPPQRRPSERHMVYPLRAQSCQNILPALAVAFVPVSGGGTGLVSRSCSFLLSRWRGRRRRAFLFCQILKHTLHARVQPPKKLLRHESAVRDSKARID